MALQPMPDSLVLVFWCSGVPCMYSNSFGTLHLFLLGHVVLLLSCIFLLLQLGSSVLEFWCFGVWKSAVTGRLSIRYMLFDSVRGRGSQASM